MGLPIRIDKSPRMELHSLHSLRFRDDGDRLTIAMYRDYFQFST